MSLVLEVGVACEPAPTYSEFVDEVIEGGDASTETLAGTDLGDELVGLGTLFHGVTVHLFPMIEDALREGTAGSGGTESLGETEGLGDGEEGVHVDERGALDGLLRLDDTTTLGEALVDATNGVIGALDLDAEDGLNESGGSGELGSVEDTTGGGHDLATTSVDSIGVKSDVHDVETDSTHLLVGHTTLLGGPLESGLGGVLDLVKVLDLLGGINEKVGTGGLWAEAPDLLGIIGIPLVVVLEEACALLHLLLGGDLVILDGSSELLTHGGGNTEHTVMLVR